jgi:hypothetical protein
MGSSRERNYGIGCHVSLNVIVGHRTMRPTNGLMFFVLNEAELTVSDSVERNGMKKLVVWRVELDTRSSLMEV